MFTDKTVGLGFDGFSFWKMTLIRSFEQWKYPPIRCKPLCKNKIKYEITELIIYIIHSKSNMTNIEFFQMTKIYFGKTGFYQKLRQFSVG